MRHLSLLIVEDNPEDVERVLRYLRKSTQCSYDCVHVSSLHEAQSRVLAAHFDTILLDLNIEDERGLDTIVRLRTETSITPIVVLTGVEDIESAIAALRLGAQDYLVKGELSATLLEKSILYAIERNALRSELQLAHAQLENRAVRQDILANQLSSFSRLVVEDFRVPLSAIENYVQQLRLLSSGRTEPLEALLIENLSTASTRLKNLLDRCRKLVVNRDYGITSQKGNVALLLEELVTLHNTECEHNEISVFVGSMGHSPYHAESLRLAFQAVFQHFQVHNLAPQHSWLEFSTPQEECEAENYVIT